jgi:hypothetical protein
LLYMSASCSINCTKTKLSASSSFRTILKNKWITDARYRTADSKKPHGNVLVGRLACSSTWKLSFSVFPRVALPFPQFALVHSVACVQLRLITILGNCCCVAVASFLGVSRPNTWHYFNHLCVWDTYKEIFLIH